MSCHSVQSLYLSTGACENGKWPWRRHEQTPRHANPRSDKWDWQWGNEWGKTLAVRRDREDVFSVIKTHFYTPVHKQTVSTYHIMDGLFLANCLSARGPWRRAKWIPTEANLTQHLKKLLNPSTQSVGRGPGMLIREAQTLQVSKTWFTTWPEEQA